MSRYRIITFILLSLFSFQGMAQQEAKPNLNQHIVNLNNGSSLIGVILDYGEGRPAIIELADGEKIEVPYTSIESILPLSQKRRTSKIRNSKDAPYSFNETGWHYNGNIGLISRGSSRLGSRIGLSIDAGAVYNFNRLLGLGISIGYDSYAEGGFQDFVPIQVVLTGYLSPKKTTFFYSLSTGYAIAVSELEDSEWLQQTSKGGVVIYPKLGIRLSGHDGINTTLFSGIKIQKSTLERRWGEEFEESISQGRTLKRLIIGIGIVF